MLNMSKEDFVRLTWGAFVAYGGYRFLRALYLAWRSGMRGEYD